MDEDRQELEISQVDTQINEEANEQNLTQVFISDPNKEFEKYCKTNGLTPLAAFSSNHRINPNSCFESEYFSAKY